MPRRYLLVVLAAAAAAAAAWTVPLLLEHRPGAQAGLAGEPPRNPEAKGRAEPPAKPKPTTAADRLREAEALARVKRLILDGYVEDVDEKRLFYGSLRGMVHELDPHSAFLTPEEYQDMTASTTGKFGGLGIEVTVKDAWLTVVTPLMGSPAFRAGVLPGDRIIRIDGADTESTPLEEAVHKMRGKPNTKVVLTVARKGENKLLDIEIVRQVINVESVRIPQILDEAGKIGYVSVTTFQEDTAEELAKALTKLGNQGLKALVLDLRVNGGGRLDAAIKVADLFLDEGVIVSVKGRTGAAHVERAKKAGTHPNYPMVVLVNQSSASASEIVAGALRDHHRAVLVGEKTFGKGSVQTLRDVRIGDEVAGLKLTTAYYYTPSGQCIHKIGIDPDIKVAMDLEVLSEVLRRQHDKWVEQNAPKNGAEKKPDDKEKPAAPPAAEKPVAPAPPPASSEKEKTSDQPGPAGEAKAAEARAAADKAKFVDLQLEAALTALRAMIIDRDRAGPLRKYDPPDDKKAAAGKGAKTPPALVPDPVEELIPVE